MRVEACQLGQLSAPYASHWYMSPIWTSHHLRVVPPVLLERHEGGQEQVLTVTDEIRWGQTKEWCSPH
jgi:hypothetical protein